MSYGGMGKCKWINEDDLIKIVNKTYLDHLIEFPAFTKLIEKDEKYQQEYKEKLKPLHEEMGKLSSEENGNSQDLVTNMDKLMHQQKAIEANLKKEWVKAKLKITNV